MSSPAPLALSFVIPLYNSAETLRPLVRVIEELRVSGGHELILVNDGSRDATSEVCRECLLQAKIPITFIEHARNFGEHNAVLTGWRHAKGEYIVNLDDDGQNPPEEALRLWQHARERDLDVVFGCYQVKQHAAWRNWGSWMTNRMTDWALDKPAGLYLSSFRCVSGFVAREAAANVGPFPYIDGLLIGGVFLWWWTGTGPAFGWGSLMASLLLFSGVQLVILGMIGEYVGRMFLTVNQRPQSIVRRVLTAHSTKNRADS